MDKTKRYNRMTGGFNIYPFRPAISQLVAKTGIVPNFKGVLPDEKHVPFGNYMGPQTKLDLRLRRGDKGTTASDEGARQHDIDYRDIGTKLKSKQITKDQASKLVRDADNKLQATIRAGLSKDKSLLNKVHASMGDTGMKVKKIAEDVGLLSGTSFLGAGKKKKQDPAMRLRILAKRIKMKNKHRRGGATFRQLNPHLPRPPPVVGTPISTRPVRIVLPRYAKGGADTTFDVDKQALADYLESLPKPILEEMDKLAKSGGLLKLVKIANRKVALF